MTARERSIHLQTPQPYGAIDLTKNVAAAVETWPDGPLIVSLQHTTAGLALGPADDGQMRDYARFAERGLLDLGPFEHVHAHEDVRNGREHLLSTVVGTQVVLRVRDGRLMLGRWQRVLLFEFDGPKMRRIDIASLGGD